MSSGALPRMWRQHCSERRPAAAGSAPLAPSPSAYPNCIALATATHGQGMLPKMHAAENAYAQNRIGLNGDQCKAKVSPTCTDTEPAFCATSCSVLVAIRGCLAMLQGSNEPDARAPS